MFIKTFLQYILIEDHVSRVRCPNLAGKTSINKYLNIRIFEIKIIEYSNIRSTMLHFLNIFKYSFKTIFQYSLIPDYHKVTMNVTKNWICSKTKQNTQKCENVTYSNIVCEFDDNYNVWLGDYNSARNSYIGLQLHLVWAGTLKAVQCVRCRECRDGGEISPLNP
jgi:hypothetical protein